MISKTYRGNVSSLEADSDRLSTFEKLILTEQYVSLLQCFWFNADWETLQGALYARQPANVDILFGQLNRLPVNVEIKLEKEESLKNLLGSYGHFLLYFQYFGFWDVKLDGTLEPKTKVRAKSFTIKPFLKPLIPILQRGFECRLEQYEIGYWGSFEPHQFPREEVPSFDTKAFVSILKPYFEEGQLENVLQKKEKVVIQGEYIFKVAYAKSCWRTIALHDSHTLLDLHVWIQKAFSFLDDHLYAFYMDNQPFSSNCYNSPHDTEGPFVNEATIGGLYLQEGQRFLYLFDFGDEWTFTVTLEEIREGIEAVLPSIRDERGESPKQYGWF
ncbi:IS1096 element passenger TnpR family protein [Solibacillus silvestris]|uniref:IS1096 element passenger TnpR family protein n=1 Tax=Solibacillus silvestris TaxID=76853 RepID=UPI003F810CEC